MLAEALMATVFSGDTLTLTAPRSTAEPWFCIRRYQVCLKIELELILRQVRWRTNDASAAGTGTGTGNLSLPVRLPAAALVCQARA
jgi:hypothetical protein